MKLSKLKIGDILTIVEEKNKDDFDYPFYGININKEFMPSVANTSNVDRKKYKIIRTNRFVFSGMQTGRDNCIRIGIYLEEKPVLVSPAYTTFEITSNKILPLYFFMIFNSKEKDRYGAFLSDSSVRSNLDWDRFCDIELEVPSIEIQRKYVAIYEGMLANLRSYEKGLEDLKLVCDGYIEDLRRKYGQEEIGKYIEIRREKNSDDTIKDVYGVSTTLEFITASSSVNTSNLSTYKIVNYNDIAYVPTTHMKVYAIAISSKDKPFVVSPIYEVFAVKDKNKLLPEFLFLWLCRSETIRYAFYNSWGSARENFVFDDLCTIQMPIPDIEMQHQIVDVFHSLNARKKYVESLKDKISSICPILIRGSILEAQGGK